VNIEFFLNDTLNTINSDPLTRLSDLLRDNFDLHRFSRGCNKGECGLCIVLMDNKPVLSCLVPAFRVKEKRIITYEGFRDSEDCNDIETGFTEAGFSPCKLHKISYVFLVHYLLERVSHPGETEIAAYFAGFHPICGGYSALRDGIDKAAALRFIRHNEQAR